jgi:HK97 family phage portal protein
MGIRAAWNALWSAPEQRDILSTDPRLEALLGGYSLRSGQVVNVHTAQNLATVLACVSAISSAIASLPVWVYRRTGTGRAVDEQHALMRLHREGANQFQTWPDFVEWLVASTLLSGNGLAEIVVDQRGELSALRAVPWSWSSVQMLPNGRLAYDVSEQMGLFGATGRTKRLLQDQVLHVRDRSDDGILGISRLRRAAGVIGAAIGIQEFASGSLSNGIYPSGVVTAEGLLNEPAFKALAERFKAFAGAQGAAKALILDQGLKWNSLTISPEDAELLASRRFTVEELARLYNVPPNIVGDLTNSSFTNSETMVRLFATATLAPWCRKLEAAIAWQVFSQAERATHLVEFDLSGLLRADPEIRWASHKIAIEAGILTPNEIREQEGWNPRPDSDVPLASPQ